MSNLSSHVQVYLKTTGTCNLNCSHCFTSGSRGQKIFFKPGPTVKFLRRLTTSRGVKSMRVIYHGGEPMLAPLKDLYEFADEIRKGNIEVEFGIQTNLVYPLTDSKKEFLKKVISYRGVGTSWDPEIRFGSTHPERKLSDLLLWEKNVRALIDDRFELTLMVSLSKDLIETYSPLDVIQYAIDLGFKYILFERITNDGNASLGSDILPHNKEIDQWLMRMYQQTIEHKLYDKIGNMFLEEIALSYLEGIHSANRCRGCEQKIITINADGSLAGCPNSATEENWGNISHDPESFLSSDKRVSAMCKEKVRNENCFSCEVSQLCNGDCYKLKWDDDICGAPKTLMKYLKTHRPTSECERLILK